MGQFSWLDCLDGRQVKDNVSKKVYVLVPKEFGGGHIEETCYDGYGRFGGYDIYELVAEWNRFYLSSANLSKKPDDPMKFGGLYFFEIEEMRKNGASDEKIQAADMEKRMQNLNAAVKRWEKKAAMIDEYKTGSSDKELSEKYGADFKREIGIAIACYDEDNARLKYPIKITHSATAVYEECGFSKGDPNQGW